MDKERKKPKHASPVACLSMTAKLIMSLRDDVRAMSQETGMCGTSLNTLNIDLMMYGRARWHEAEGTRKDYNCTDSSGQEILYLRALQGHSGRNLIDPSLQNNICRICNHNLHSIIDSGLILGGQILSNRQTVFFTSVDPMNKEHKDPDEIHLDAPRLAWYTQKVCKKHQNTVYWVDINLALKKELKFCQT